MIEIVKLSNGRIFERFQDGTVGFFEASPFLLGYLAAALWSSHADDGEPMDDDYEVEDFSPAFLSQAFKDCLDFEMLNRADLAAYYAAGFDESHAGYDFWLTRAGHGAGFWDRGLDELGDRLTSMADPYGSIDLYVGDDGFVHGG